MKRYEGTFIAVGPPGTGKTTFLAHRVKEICEQSESQRTDGSSPVVICSLTRTAASEIASRDLPIPRWQIGTLHAHAYRQLGKPPIAETMIEQWNEQCHGMYRIEDDSMRSDLDEMPTESRSSFGDRDSGTELLQEYQLLRNRMTPRDSWRGSVKAFADAWERWKGEVGALDFTDMILNALEDCDIAPGRPEVICLDEGQDMSRCEIDLAKKWGAKAGALIIAGDPLQAIYVWRGADPSIFYDGSVPEEKRRLLHQSFRVPQAVRNVALAWARQMRHPVDITYRARVDKETGETVRGDAYTSNATYMTPEYAVDTAEHFLDQGDSVMFCASCGYMLNKTISELKTRGIPFCNPRRRDKPQWNPLAPTKGVRTSRRLADFLRIDHGAHQVDAENELERWRLWTGAELQRWASKMKVTGCLKRGIKKTLSQLAKLKENEPVSATELMRIFDDGGMDDIARMIDPDDPMSTKDLLEWFCDHAAPEILGPARYPIQIVRKIGLRGLEDAMRRDPLTFVGSIHSYKGAEADHVIIYPDLSPAGYAEWDSFMTRDNIIRAFYVAVTRARKSVTICTNRSPRAVNLASYVRYAAGGSDDEN